MIKLKTKNWQIDNIETVLFDKDGTFIDLHYFWGKMTELRCLEIIKRFNLDESYISDLCLYLGYDKKEGKMLPDGITALYSRQTIIQIFKKDLEKFDVFLSEIELAQIFDYVSEIFYENMFEYVKPIKSAIDFIEKLYLKDVKLGVVTSDSVESTKLTLKHFNWEKYFSIAIGRECSSDTKESGALTKIALDKLNANPKTTIMIGDAPMDYKASINANIDKTILVASGQISEKELEKTSKYCVESLDEIEII